MAAWARLRLTRSCSGSARHKPGPGPGPSRDSLLTTNSRQLRRRPGPGAPARGPGPEQGPRESDSTTQAKCPPKLQMTRSFLSYPWPTLAVLQKESIESRTRRGHRFKLKLIEDALSQAGGAHSESSIRASRSQISFQMVCRSEPPPPPPPASVLEASLSPATGCVRGVTFRTRRRRMRKGNGVDVPARPCGILRASKEPPCAAMLRAQADRH